MDDLLIEPQQPLRAASPTFSVVSGSVSNTSSSVASSANYQFVCQMDTTDSLRALLSALELEKSNQPRGDSALSATLTSSALLRCRVKSAGLKLSALRSRVLSARAYFKSNLCRTWHFSGQAFTFTVALQRLTQALSMFTPQARLTLRVPNESEHVELMMEENNIIAECNLSCVAVGDHEYDEDEDESDEAAKAFLAYPTVARVSVDSNQLWACLNDLDLSNCDSITMIWQRSFPRLRFAAFSPILSVMTGFCAKTGDFADSLNECIFDPMIDDSDLPLVFVYPHALIKPSLTVSSISTHANIRVNSVGMLSMQHVIHTVQQGINNWVEYLATSVAEESGEHEEAPADNDTCHTVVD